MSSFGFMALCFPVSAKRCVCPLDGQPGASKLSLYRQPQPFSLNYITFPDPTSETDAQLLLESPLVLFPFLYFSLSSSFCFLDFSCSICEMSFFFLMPYDPSNTQRSFVRHSLSRNLILFLLYCILESQFSPVQPVPNIILSFYVPSPFHPSPSMRPTWKEVTVGQWYVWRVNSG